MVFRDHQIVYPSYKHVVLSHVKVHKYQCLHSNVKESMNTTVNTMIAKFKLNEASSRYDSQVHRNSVSDYFSYDGAEIFLYTCRNHKSLNQQEVRS